MKQIVLILMSLLTFSCPSKAQKQTADTDRPSDKKILVAYFSCTGTTEKVATAIAKETGGKLYRITPATAYTSADLDWNDKASRSSVEMTDEKSRPALGGETIDLKDYDVVFLGYPIWWDLCPRPVNTFLEKFIYVRWNFAHCILHSPSLKIILHAFQIIYFHTGEKIGYMLFCK